MSRVRAFFVFVVTLIAMTSGDAMAERRIALVIGNDRYANVPALEKAVNDARRITETLKTIGFTVLTAENVDQRTMSRRLVEFTAQVQPGDTAFVFFAGHGFEITGRNYLLPVDVPMAGEGQEDLVRDLAFAADSVVDRLRTRGARTTVMVLDACRNNPFERPGGRSLSGGRGLARMDTTEGVFIMFSAGQKQEALDRLSDRDADSNSVFTRFFARHLITPGATMLDIAKRTQTDVKKLASTIGREQMPAFYDQIVGDLVLIPKQAQETAAAQQKEQPTVPAGTIEAVESNVATKLARLPDQTGRTRSDVVTECDRLAASPADGERPRNISGVQTGKIDIVPAIAACDEAMRQHPEIPRFTFQAARIALAQNDTARARPLFERAAALGSVVAMTNLGVLHARGSAGKQDFAEARRWYERAAAAGEGVAMLNLGLLYRDGSGVTQDHAEAKRWLTKAASLGLGNAMSNLGYMASNGWGGPQDYAEAKRWYEQAAALNDNAGMNNLGWLYEHGRGLAADLGEARRWYERAANAGHNGAMHSLALMHYNGRGVTRDYAAAFRWFERSSSLGHASSTNYVGLLYDRGHGVGQNISEAKKYYERAAAMGESYAINNLGWLYQNGNAVSLDYAEARRHYVRAANLDNPLAMVNLGQLYDHGQGGPKDHREAKKLYERAAALNNAMAMNNLGVQYNNGLGVARDDREAMRWYQKAAGLGNSLAMRNIGNLHEHGQGVPKNRTEAVNWYQRAASAGDEESVRRLSRLRR